MQMIPVLALMIQSYIVTENENKRLNSNLEFFECLVGMLDCAMRATSQRSSGFAVIELIEVGCFMFGVKMYNILKCGEITGFSPRGATRCKGHQGDIWHEEHAIGLLLHVKFPLIRVTKFYNSV